METVKIKLGNLRNNEHYQFMSDVISLIKISEPKKLRIEPFFNMLSACYALEGKALNRVTKSQFTNHIIEADRNRDETFRGMADANLSAVKHFKQPIREAANRLQIVFDAYGNITKKAIAEQTASVNSLLNELASNHAEDVKAVGLGEWIDELKRRNNTLTNLMNDRYTETASQSEPLVLRELRKKTDDAYRSTVKRINALMEVDGGEYYESFIRQINAIIIRAGNIIAARRGHAGKKETGNG